MGPGSPVSSFLLQERDFSLGFSQLVLSFVSVSTVQTKRCRWKSFCITSWMTLSLDLVNKCSLRSSCVPSARITHNPGTGVDHREAGVQKCELYTV